MIKFILLQNDKVIIKLKQISLLLLYGTLYLLLFHGVFTIFQNPDVYIQSLGKISSNYVRTGGWSDGKIIKRDTAFVERTADNYLNWDAAIYHCIAERMYKREDSCYGKVRAAFFPAFPLIWKFTGLSPPAMGVLNFLIFSFGLALILSFFSTKGFSQNLILYLILLSLPSSIIFQMPYTESLFLLTMTIGCIGIWKDKHWLYFLGFAFMAIVRPATIFVLFAIGIADLVRWLQSGSSFSTLIKPLILKALPFIIGYIIAFGIQIYSSGSFTAFWDAHSFWSSTVPSNWQIVDWSVEGFAMNAFTIFFVAIPATIASIRVLFSKLSQKKNYLIGISLLYLVGIFAFTVITSGGNLHSFFRFELASPCFFIAVVLFLDRERRSIWKELLKLIALPLLGLLFFFALVEYGGSPYRFEYAGALMLILGFTYLIIQRRLSPGLRYSLLVLLLVGNIVFSTYLLNMYLSNVWIFT